jgi:hypothetical protein
LNVYIHSHTHAHAHAHAHTHAQLELRNNALDSEGAAAGGVLPASLKKLDISMNRLGPTFDMQLPARLTWLDLSGNRLRGEVGENFALFVNVKELNLDNNGIAVLGAEGLGGMKKLRVLSVRNNNIEHRIAAAVFTDTVIDRIHLEGNPMTKKCLMELDGFDVFDKRRQKRLSKEIAGGLHDTDRSVCGLDD